MDEECEELTALWKDSISGESSGRCGTPAAYHREARLLIGDERCYKITSVCHTTLNLDFCLLLLSNKSLVVPATVLVMWRVE